MDNDVEVSRSSDGGSLVIGGGVLDVANDVDIGNGSHTGQLTHNGGEFSLGAITVGNGSRYDLTGGTLSIADRFDLTGVLDFGGGDASITLADNGVTEWSTGTLAGDASNTHYTAGLDSESYFPVGFNPYTKFASFSSQGIVHSTNTPIVIPITFSGRVFRLTADNLFLNGSVIMEQGGVINANSVTLIGGSLSGHGTVNTAGFVNSGTLSPGENAGAIAINGTYEQNIDGALDFELGGYIPGTSYDVLEIDGSAMLAGTLSVTLTDVGGNLFLPKLGERFTILTAANGVSGAFDTVSKPVVNGLSLVAFYDTNNVTLLTVLLGDMDDDRDVDFDDIDYFVLGINDPETYQNQIGLPSDAMGDIDNDGDLDFDDTPGFVAILGGEGVQAVPEPSTIFLALVGAIGFVVLRRQRTSKFSG